MRRRFHKVDGKAGRIAWQDSKAMTACSPYHESSTFAPLRAGYSLASPTGRAAVRKTFNFGPSRELSRRLAAEQPLSFPATDPSKVRLAFN